MKFAFKHSMCSQAKNSKWILNHVVVANHVPEMSSEPEYFDKQTQKAADLSSGDQNDREYSE